MARQAPVCVFDFTIPYDDGSASDKIIEILEKFCKKFVFQLV